MREIGVCLCSLENIAHERVILRTPHLRSALSLHNIPLPTQKEVPDQSLTHKKASIGKEAKKCKTDKDAEGQSTDPMHHNQKAANKMSLKRERII
jgi:hypothetical protein